MGSNGYMWLGHNRTLVSNKAMRGSGGVGVLVKESVLCDWLVDMTDRKLEDVLWVQLEHRETSHAVFIVVCYFHPSGTSQEVDTEEHFQILDEQIKHFKMEGQGFVYGNFNARCGGLSDVEEESKRCCVDLEERNHGELLVVCMMDSGLVLVNGCQGPVNMHL